jgi:hypothetical protein
MSTLTGNSSSSSTYVKKTNALKSFGLVTDQNNELVLTEVGETIVAPLSPEQGATAKKDAFLRVPNFSKMYERHKGKLLPDDQFLRNIFVQSLEVPAGVVDIWMTSFKDAIQAAGLISRRPDGSTQVLQGPSIQIQGKPIESKPAIQEPDPPPPGEQLPSQPTGMPIPLGRDKIAHLQLPKDWKDSDLPRLLQMIGLALGSGSYDVKVTQAAQSSPATPEQ